MLPTTMKHAFGEDLACDGRDALDPSKAPGRIVSEKDDQIAVIDAGIKLCVTRKKGLWYYEMYDLVNDPDEFENVYSDSRYAAERDHLNHIVFDDTERAGRVFYDGSGTPWWMAPPQEGIRLRPRSDSVDGPGPIAR